MSIRNKGITAEINTAHGSHIRILDSYIESYTVYGKNELGEDVSYVLRYGDNFRLERAQPEIQRPTQAGQVVRDERGNVGVTTDSPTSRTPRIPVQLVGGSYPVLLEVDSLEVIEITGTRAAI